MYVLGHQLASFSPPCTSQHAWANNTITNGASLLLPHCLLVWTVVWEKWSQDSDSNVWCSRDNSLSRLQRIQYGIADFLFSSPLVIFMCHSLWGRNYPFMKKNKTFWHLILKYVFLMENNRGDTVTQWIMF